MAPAAAGQLEHAAFLPGEDGDERRHVASRLLRGQRVHAVREHADGDAAAVDAVRAARHVRPVGDVSLAGVDLAGRRACRPVRPAVGGESLPHGLRHRLVRRPDRLHRDEAAERLKAAERQAGPDGPVAGHAADHGPAQVANALENGRRHVRPDVHQHPTAGRVHLPQRPIRGLERSVRGAERRIRSRLPPRPVRTDPPASIAQDSMPQPAAMQ